MTTAQMRAAIAGVYPGKKWQKKVANMYDDQVFAVYQSFLRSGKFNEPKKEPVRKEHRESKGDRQKRSSKRYHDSDQLSWDI